MCVCMFVCVYVCMCMCVYVCATKLTIIYRARKMLICIQVSVEEVARQPRSTFDLGRGQRVAGYHSCTIISHQRRHQLQHVEPIG